MWAAKHRWDSHPLLDRTCGAILFRTEVREVVRAEGPAVHPAKGEALLYRSHRVFYSAVSCVVRPNGPRVHLNSPTVRVGLKTNSRPVGPDVAENKKGFWWGRRTRASPFAGGTGAPSGPPPPRARNRNGLDELSHRQRLLTAHTECAGYIGIELVILARPLGVPMFAVMLDTPMTPH